MPCNGVCGVVEKVDEFEKQVFGGLHDGGPR